MAGTGEPADGRALWRRWRTLAVAGMEDRALAPDPLLLAAYAEGRLDEAAAAPVELWLAAHPETLTETLADLTAARAAPATEAAPEAFIARAAALVGAADPKIVAFRRPQVRGLRNWRSLAAWSGIAASLLATSLIGFELGSDTYVSLTGSQTSAISAFHDLFDPPGGILPGLEDDSTT